MRPLHLALLSALLTSTAAAQALDVQCFDGLRDARGMSAALDADGALHLIRQRGVPSDLYYNVISPDGAIVTEETIDARASRVGNWLTDTGLLLEPGGDHRACYYHSQRSQLRMATKNGDAWDIELIDAGRNVGVSCDLYRRGDDLIVVYDGGDGTLKTARRNGPNDWAAEVISNGEAGRGGGEGASLAVRDDGLLAVVHRSPDHFRLYVTHEVDDGWATETIFLDQASGVRLHAAFDPDGVLYIAHGRRSGELDVESDGGLVLTHGPVEGPFVNESFDGAAALGGAQALGRVGIDDTDRLGLAGRERSRSAVFGSRDGFFYYPALHPLRAVGMSSQADGARHTVQRPSLLREADGLPVIVWWDDRLAAGDDPGASRPCVARPTDGDGDDLIDTLEAEVGADPEDPDSDGDGRSDGLEVHIDFTDPAVEDEPGPDLDAAVIDAQVIDAALPDAQVIDAQVIDAQVIDAAIPDAAVIDAALPDAAIPDAAIPDAELIDAALPDAANPDAALPDPDAMIPDAARPDPDAMLPDAARPDPDAAPPEDMTAPADMAPRPDMADMAAPTDDMALATDDMAVDASDMAADAADARPIDASPITDGEITGDDRDATRLDYALPPIRGYVPDREFEPTFASCRSTPGRPSLPAPWALLLALPLLLRRR